MVLSVANTKVQTSRRQGLGAMRPAPVAVAFITNFEKTTEQLVTMLDRSRKVFGAKRPPHPYFLIILRVERVVHKPDPIVVPDVVCVTASHGIDTNNDFKFPSHGT